MDGSVSFTQIIFSVMRDFFWSPTCTIELRIIILRKKEKGGDTNSHTTIAPLPKVKMT